MTSEHSLNYAYGLLKVELNNALLCYFACRTSKVLDIISRAKAARYLDEILEM